MSVSSNSVHDICSHFIACLQPRLAMEISVKLFAYCFIVCILHCPNFAQANDEDLENFLLSLGQCL